MDGMNFQKQKLVDLLHDEERINKLLMQVKFLKPMKASDFFIKKHFEDENINYEELILNGKLNDYRDKINKLKSKWTNMNIEERLEFERLEEKDKNRYLRDLEIIKTYIFKGFNGKISCKPTAYRLFLNEKLIEGLNKNIQPKDIKKEAREIWKKMDIKEKILYRTAKNENDNIFDEIIKHKYVSPFFIFMNNELNIYRKKKKKKPSLKELIDTWNKLSKSETEKYIAFTKEIKEEQNNMQDLYDIVRGIKPKIPTGAYRTFLEEKAAKGIISSISEGEKLWDSLKEEEKEKYIGYCHRKVLAYKYKQLIYHKKIKGILPKKPCGVLQIFYKKIKGLKHPDNEHHFIYYKKLFDNLPKEKKNIYIKEYEKQIEKYTEKIKEFKDCIFDIPNNPKSPFSCFCIENLKKKMEENGNPKKSKIEVLEELIKMWKELNDEQRNIYIKKSEIEAELFLKQMEMFEKFGYYKKDKSLLKAKKDNNNIQDKDENIAQNEFWEKKKIKKRKSELKERKHFKKNANFDKKNNNQSWIFKNKMKKDDK